jgi:hypothetical protein|tara:strand:- start:209 stop:352 length:144 start_codon:yes stop_codon:yes gene_type:complete
MKRKRITTIESFLVGSSNSTRSIAIFKSEKKERKLMKKGFFKIIAIE